MSRQSKQQGGHLVAKENTQGCFDKLSGVLISPDVNLVKYLMSIQRRHLYSLEP